MSKEYKRECSHGETLDWKYCAECREYFVRSGFEEELEEALESQMSELRKEAVEPLAKVVYDKMSYTENGVKPEWTVGGNSFKQDEARRIVINALDEVLLLMKK